MTRIIATPAAVPGQPELSCADVELDAGIDFVDADGDSADAAIADAPIVLRATSGAGERLDRFLAASLPQHDPHRFGDLSRARVQRWIALGAVHCDGRVLPAKTRLSGIETIVVEPQPREADTSFAPEPVPLDVVWRDAALIVVDKPAGLVVHPAAGNWHGTLLNGLLDLDPALATLPRAGIVHRLDKDTSGLLVVARTEAAMAALAAQLADRSMGRRYLALVVGDPGERGTVDAPIARDPRARVRMAVVQAARARAARTHFRRLAVGELDGRPVALLDCRLETGRTHQIRVHLAHAGHPLVGDRLYGGPSLGGFTRQALHAWQLELQHPDGSGRRCWQAPPPDDLVRLLAAAGIDVPRPDNRQATEQPR